MTSTNTRSRCFGGHMLRTFTVRLLAALLLIACQSDPAGPGQAPRAVGEYLAALPSWSTFAPAQSEQPPTPAGAPVGLPEDTVDVNRVEEDGSVSIIPDVV